MFFAFSLSQSKSSKLPNAKRLFCVGNVVLFFVSLLLSLLLLEMMGRVYVSWSTREALVDFNNLQGNQLHQYDKRLGWSLRHQAHFFLPYEVTTNSLGLRNKELRPLEMQMRILAIGDSRTFGDGVGDEDTWPFLLEKRLNDFQPGRFEVINAGVCGWNSLQGLKYLETRGLALNPHLVLCAFGTNDWATAGIGEVGWIDWDNLRSRWGVEVLLREAIKGASSMMFDSPFGPREFRVSPGEYTDAIVRMKKLCQQQNVAFSVLYLPCKAEIGVEDESNFIFCIKWLSQGIARYTFSKFIDPTVFFPKKADEYYVDPIHFSSLGNALVAECLFEKIIETIPK